MFTISLIIPCYNVAPYIDRCLTSIANQTMGIDSLQIICVDDASTDDTWDHLQQYEQKYPDNIFLIHLDTNRRQGTCRNIAMQYIEAPWATFIDADDWIEPDYCEIMYSYASKLNCDVVCCSFFRDPSATLSFLNEARGSGIKFYLIDTVEKRKTFLLQNFMDTARLIKTSFIFDNNIYFTENVAYEDHLWGSLLQMYTESLLVLEMKLYHYFINPSSTVLTMNSLHHIDWLTAKIVEWKEWKTRGFFGLYQSELEFNFLVTCYLGFIRTLILRYNTPPYSLYLLLRQITLEHIPNYKYNPYMEDGLSDYQKLLLSALSNQLTKKEFELLVQNARIYLAIHG